MEKLVSSWTNIQTVPNSHIFPPQTRPGNQINVPQCNTIPVIDLDQPNAIQEILKASQDYGFFQVINHGVSEELMSDTIGVLTEFFELPASDKASLFSDDWRKSCRLYTSSLNYANEEKHYWRDNLRHPCQPLEECMQFWPQKPRTYRETVGKCSVEVRKLSSRILELISEGLGLQHGYFKDDLSKEYLLSVNHYPPCPQPNLTLGLPKHCDPNLLTIVLQGDVNGLQVFKDGSWIGIQPHPNAMVVNLGHQLQIISNGKLKSAEHRVVTNSSNARTSAAFFISPSADCLIEPIAGDTAPTYRAFQYKEFLAYYTTMNGNTDMSLEPFYSKA